MVNEVNVAEVGIRWTTPDDVRYEVDLELRAPGRSCWHRP
jgi:hypothetical protein